MGHQDNGTPEQWDTRTMGQRDIRTPEHWDTGTHGHWDTGTLVQWNNAPMYKKQADPIFFPGSTNILPRVFFSIKSLIWPLDPLNKGKIDFLLHF